MDDIFNDEEYYESNINLERLKNVFLLFKLVS